jgi:hypothetical protein
MQGAGTRRTVALLAATGGIAVWAACLDLKDDAMGRSNVDPIAKADAAADVGSDGAATDGGLEASGPSSDAQVSPLTIAGPDLRLWLKADQGVACVSGRVTRWADQSVNHDDATLDHDQLGPQCQISQDPHVVQGTDLPYFSAPLNGNVVDETLDVDLSYLTGADYTIFAVERRWADYESGSLNDEMVLGTMVPIAYDGIIGANCPVANITLQLGYIYYNGPTQLVLDQWCNAVSSAIAGIGASGSRPLSQETAQFDRTRGHEVWLGGVPAAADANVNPLANADEGAVGSALTRSTAVGVDPRFRGDIAEIVVYSVALNSDDRQAVERYLAERWVY